MALFISVNISSSIDGKIATAKRGPVDISSKYDKQRMEEIRAEADCIMMGAHTFAVHPFSLKINKKNLLLGRRKKGMAEQPTTAIVSSSLHLPKRTPWERDQSVRRIVFCGANYRRDVFCRLQQAGVEIFVASTKRPSANFICTVLKKIQMKRVLLEGGGELNATFFEAKLVHRLYLTICAVTIGGANSPTLFEGKGFSLAQRDQWRLRTCVRKNNELFLTYDRLG